MPSPRAERREQKEGNGGRIINMRVESRVLAEIFTSDEITEYLKLNPDNDEDNLVEGYIVAAREYAENRTGASIAMTNYVVTIESPEKRMALIKPPIISINSVTKDGADIPYTLDGNTIVFDDYIEGNVVVDYTAGYTNCPEEIKVAMKMLIGHWYSHREAVYVSTGSVTSKSSPIAMGVDAILNQYKVWWF